MNGANSPLGKYLKYEIKKTLEVEVIEGSSQPNEHQLEFNITRPFDFNEVKNVDFLLHLASPIDLTKENLNLEINLLNRFRKQSIPIINIASVSGCRKIRNKYGIYKKEIENWCIFNNEINLRCGLLFGEGYFGQLFKMHQILKRFPVRPFLSDSGQILLTPVDKVLSAIMKVVACKGNGLDINPLLTSYTFFDFNDILRDLSRKNALKINLNISLVNKILKVINIKGKFSVDRFLGTIGEFDVGCLGNNYNMSNLELNSAWHNYLNYLKFNFKNRSHY